MLVGVVALAACQSVDTPRSSTPPTGRDRLDLATADAPPASTGYPSLYTVPPRPHLSYTVQQQRAIVDGLVADRELARYTDQVVRYRSGESSLPPPPEPPREVAAVDTEGLVEPAPADAEAPAPAADTAAATPYDDDAGFSFGDDDQQDTLDNFINNLASDSQQQQDDEAGVPGPSEEPANDGGAGLLNWLGGLFGWSKPEASASTGELATVPAMQPAPVVAQDVPAADAALPRPRPEGPGIAVGAEGVAIEGGGAPATATAAAASETAAGKASIAPAPAKPMAAVDLPAKPPGANLPAASIAFAPDSAELPNGAGAQLEEVLALAKAQGAVIRILGEGSAPALALDRARAVGLALVRLGAGASDLEMTLAAGAKGDQARLLLAGPGSR